MATNRQKEALQAARNMWNMGAFSIVMLFALGMLAALLLKGDYLINFFGVESARQGNTTSVRIGIDALVGFLLFLPAIAAGVAYYKNK